MQDVIACLDRNANELTDMARRIWENQELGLIEFRSSALQAEALTAAGFAVTTGVGGMRTAISATWGSGGPAIGFLGEFDALPGLSQEAGVAERRPVRAGEPGHGCGLNLLGTAHLGAALALKSVWEAGACRVPCATMAAPRRWGSWTVSWRPKPCALAPRCAGPCRARRSSSEPDVDGELRRGGPTGHHQAPRPGQCCRARGGGSW